MSTDIAESLPKRKFAQAAIANAPATTTPKGKSDGGKKVVKNQLQQKVVVAKVPLKRGLKKEFVRQFMILDIVQEEKI